MAGQYSHRQSKLRAFAHLLGDNFDRDDEIQFESAFEDFVYFANFGWNDISDWDVPPAHESSLGCCAQDIFIEDLVDVASKLDGLRTNSILERAYPANEGLRASSIFEEMVPDELLHAWKGQVEATHNSVKILERDFVRCLEGRIASLPGIGLNSSKLTGAQISDESLISIAKRAGCFSLHRSTYEILRQVASNYVSMMLSAVCNSKPMEANTHCLLTAADIQCDLMTRQKTTMVGYGYKGLKHVFDHELSKETSRMRPDIFGGKADLTALGAMSDMMCSLLDRIVQAAASQCMGVAANVMVTDVQFELSSAESSAHATGSNFGHVVVTKDGCCCSSAHQADVTNLLTLASVKQATLSLLTGNLRDVALRRGDEIVTEFRSSVGETHFEGFEKLRFDPGHVAAVSMVLHPDVTFTDEALLFTTAVIQLIAGEVVELSVNNAIDSFNAVVNTRNVMSVILMDDELLSCFGDMVYRDAGSRVFNNHYVGFAWTARTYASINQQLRDENPGLNVEQDEVDLQEYQDYSENIFRNYPDHAKFIDARTGFLMHKVHRDCTSLDRAANASTRESKKHLRDKAIADLKVNNQGLLDTLKREHPLDASAESLRCLDLRKLHRSSRDIMSRISMSTGVDIHKAAVREIVSGVSRSIESTGRRFQLTHEAFNSVHLALENYLYRVLNDASGKAFVSGHTIVSPHHVIECVRASEVVMAVNSRNFDRVTEMISEDRTRLHGTFQCQSALSIACDADDVEFLDWLVANGADLNLIHQNPNAMTFGNSSPDGCLLFRAVRGNKTRVLDAILHRHSSRINFAVEMSEGGLFNNRVNALMVLCKMKDANLNLIEEIVSRGVDINAQDTQHNTAFAAACTAGNIAVAEKLILLGADTEKSGTEGFFRRKPMDNIRNPVDRERLLKAKELVATPSLK